MVKSLALVVPIALIAFYIGKSEGNLFRTIGSVEKSPSCPTNTDYSMPIFLPHETNCSKYYMCFMGYKYEMSCPANLQFDTILNVCTYPDKANCQINCKNICPKPCPNKYQEDYADLSQYYGCKNGTTVRYKCPEGLYFSNKLRICDFPYNIKYFQ